MRRSTTSCMHSSLTPHRHDPLPLTFTNVLTFLQIESKAKTGCNILYLQEICAWISVNVNSCVNFRTWMMWWRGCCMLIKFRKAAGL